MLESLSDRLFASPLASALQAGIILGASLLIFLIFYATRDVLLRSRSLVLQVLSILLVACFPVVGFLLYLLIRPARTVREKEMERAMQQMHKDILHQHELLQAMQGKVPVKTAPKKPALKVREIKTSKRPVQQELQAAS